MQAFQTPRPAPGYQQPYLQQPPAGYKAPQAVEVYVLNDHANASIPQDIRDQFQRDEKGRILFFTAPPLNIDQPLTEDGRVLGHSARYLAAKAKKDTLKAAKRSSEDASIEERKEAAKKAKAADEAKFTQAVSDLGAKAIKALEDQLADATVTKYQSVFNGDTTNGMVKVLDRLTKVQDQAFQAELERTQHIEERAAAKRITVTGMTAQLEEKY